MSCVHYKFSSKLNYDTVTFDGLHISLSDLKRQIMGREKLKAADCDLQITNAQTKEGAWGSGAAVMERWLLWAQSCSFVAAAAALTTREHGFVCDGATKVLVSWSCRYNGGRDVFTITNLPAFFEIWQRNVKVIGIEHMANLNGGKKCV